MNSNSGSAPDPNTYINLAKLGSYTSNPNVITPYGGQTVTWDQYGQQPTITQYLNGTQSSTLNNQQQAQNVIAQLGYQAANQAYSRMANPFNYSGPNVQTSFYAPSNINYGPGMGTYGTAQAGPSASQYGLATGAVQNTSAGTGPSVGAYGLLGGGPSAAGYTAEQGPRLGELGMAQAGPASGSFGYAQGGPSASQFAARSEEHTSELQSH